MGGLLRPPFQLPARQSSAGQLLETGGQLGRNRPGVDPVHLYGHGRQLVLQTESSSSAISARKRGRTRPIRQWTFEKRRPSWGIHRSQRPKSSCERREVRRRPQRAKLNARKIARNAVMLWSMTRYRSRQRTQQSSGNTNRRSKHAQGIQRKNRDRRRQHRSRP